MGLGGDSADANLALSAAIALRDSNNDNVHNNNDVNTNVKQHNLLRVLYLLHGPYMSNLLNSTFMVMFDNAEFGLTYASMKYVRNQTFQKY